MRIRLRQSWAIVWLLLHPLLCCAQTDFQTWSSITIGKQLNSRWSLRLKEELRLRDYSQALRVLFTDLGGRYHPTEHLTTGLHYRLLIRPWGISHRIYEETNVRWRPGKIELAARIRLQHEFRKGPDLSYIRTRPGITYRLNKTWRPNLHIELFYHIFNHTGDQFDEIRIMAGTDFRINKQHELSAHLQYEYEFTQSPRFQALCLLINYDLDL
ncbi:MAG: DUF2490 domain-containing protein [Chitinophagales bacterium]|nr:DUF2490 domain-containing protein [Chitinophagales bacterium]MDW8427405.1 DUF2490 domain-containing protein [Chitinophagales bacterium]